MKRNKFLFVLLLLCSLFLVTACKPDPTPEPQVDYDLVLEDALSKVKISGVATTANRNFTVPLELKHTYEEKEYTIALSWESSNPQVISLSGASATVTRPKDGDVKVKLTCTLALEGKTKTKEFNLDVYKAEKTVDEILNEGKTELDSNLESLGISAITGNITLPVTAGLASVSWKSDNISIITTTGEVNRPTFGLGDASVKMTATLSSGGIDKDFEYTFVVKEQDRPADSELPALAATFLKLPSGDVTTNLELPTSGMFETSISWTSSHPEIIASNGTVTQPAAKTGEAVVVKLTATISLGEYSAEKVFRVSVPELAPANNQEKASVAFSAMGIDLAVVAESEIELPSSSLYDLEFNYLSDDSNVSVEGSKLVITRLEEDYFVTITAKTTIEAVDYSFEFAFVVKSTSKGSGTLEDPFVVETVADLQKVGTGVDGWNLDSHYALYANIDLSSVENFTPIGTYKDGTTAIGGPFTGSFNGNGYTISNLKSNFPTYDGVGLFGYARNATIKNLYIENANVIGQVRVGALVGLAMSCNIFNVHVRGGNIEALAATDCYAGGLGGRVENITPSETEPNPANSYVQNVSVIGTTVKGQYHIGGLFGGMRNCLLSNDDLSIRAFLKDAYVEATVICTNYSGGLIGSGTGSYENIIVNSTMKQHPNPTRNYNAIGLVAGTIQHNSSLQPVTVFKNIMYTGNIQEFIDNPDGRVVSGISHTAVGNRLTLENFYMDHEPYSKRGSDDYTEGFMGVQITHENALSPDWYIGTLKSFDYENVWKLEDGKLPQLMYQNDNSAEEVVMGFLLDIPAEVTENLNLVTETNVRGIIVSWESNNPAIAVDGTVTRPAYVDGDVNVKLIARYSINGKNYVKEIDVVVKCIEPTDDEKYATVKAEIDAALGEAREITENLELITSGSHDAVISWASNNEAIAADGTVTRPLSGLANAEVVLTATVKFGDVSREFTYNYVVVAWPSEDLAVETVYNELVLVESTIANLELPTAKTANNQEVTISWSSDNAAIAADGTVTRPAYLAGDASVKLTATIICGQASKTKEFTVVVSKLDPTDDDLAEEAKLAIQALEIKDLTENITLPALREGVSVSAEATTYVSLVDNVLNVTKPVYEDGDQAYSITLVITCGSASKELVLNGIVFKNMGDGSESNPFIIDSIELLESVAKSANANKHWILKADIDLSSKYSAESGKSWTPITGFKGVFDGNGHKISGLYISSTSTFQGLFGRIDSCTIKNLTVDNANVKAGGSAGILFGQANQNATIVIENINVSGKLEGTNKDSVLGGIGGAIDGRTAAGKSSSYSVNNCYINVEIVGNRHNGGAFGQVKVSQRTGSVVISNIEVHGSILGIQTNGSLVGTVERNNVSGTTAEGTEQYVIIENAVTYNTVSANPTNAHNDAYQANCGLVAYITNNNLVPTVTVKNSIVYVLGDYASFTAGYRASFVGRSNDNTTVTITNGYVNGTPFGYNGNNVQADGSVLHYGTQLPENSALEFYTGLGFSSEIWDMGENGMVLKRGEISDEEKLAKIEAQINASLGEEREITENLTLITSGLYGASISWASNNEAIAADGTVTRPASNAGNAEVVLTATVKFGDVSKDYTFNYVVVAWPAYDLAVETVYNELVLVESTTSNLELPTAKTANGLEVVISWSSDNAAIAADGTVTRPAYLAGDASVKLTATITCGQASRTKEFTVVVSKLDPTDDDLAEEAKLAIQALDLDVLSNDVALPALKEGVSVSAEATTYLSLVENVLKVSKPSYEDGDQAYSITLVITCGSVSKELVLSGTVSKDMGSGTASDPFLIDSIETLEAVAKSANANKHWRLIVDLDLSSKYSAESGKSWTPITGFKGVFDGNGHKISGLYISSTSTFQGLFGRIDSCTIKNLTVDNANVKAGGSAGILFGQANQNATIVIENINVSGKLEGTNKDSVLGGIGGAIDGRTAAGKSSSYSVNNCYINVEIVGNRHNGGAFGQVKMNERTGSVVISNIEVHGSILGVQSNGSLVGTVERISGGLTVEGTEKYLTIEYIATYNTIGANLVNSHNDAYQANCGLVACITNNNLVPTVTVKNSIVYVLGDYASFTAGYRASFVARSNDNTTVTITNGYVNGTPFGYNGNNVQADGSVLHYGNQLPENSALEFYTGLGFSSEVWEMGENGIILK